MCMLLENFSVLLLTLLDVVAWVEADAGLTCGKLEGSACYSGVVSAASIVRMLCVVVVYSLKYRIL
jgi:hypothetical protein